MKKTFSKIDIPLFIIMVLLSLLGILMVFSSSSVAAMLRYKSSPYRFVIYQAIFFAFSYLIGFIILKIPTRVYKYISWFLICGITIALGLLFVYGKITNHAVSWFYVPFVNVAIQPAEFAKSIIILFMACYYNTLVKNKNNKIMLYFLPIMLISIITFLIILQPDLGSALILLGITFGIFISIPMNKNFLPRIATYICLGLVVGAIFFLYSGKSIMNSMQLSRLNFLNPCERYKEDTGYQVCNGFIAINNGGLFGVGLGNSTQKYLYLPESHTDFIYAILIEELGVIVGVIVLFLYIILLTRILKIAKEASNLRNSIIAYGTFWLFTFHIVVNLGGMLALIPLTGVPFPLLSYGGSSTLNFVAMLFLCERVAIENKKDKLKSDLQKLQN